MWHMLPLRMPSKDPVSVAFALSQFSMHYFEGVQLFRKMVTQKDSRQWQQTSIVRVSCMFFFFLRVLVVQGSPPSGSHAHKPK